MKARKEHRRILGERIKYEVWALFAIVGKEQQDRKADAEANTGLSIKSNTAMFVFYSRK